MRTDGCDRVGDLPGGVAVREREQEAMRAFAQRDPAERGHDRHQAQQECEREQSAELAGGLLRRTCRCLSG
ncbi:hypothetical protein [Burkholderia pseudomallei]|uniref:hypothetical protein n=1 Tax=Burkholderia pseudomallei TaxID=28450 RepID=UPI002116AE5C|nr:hypothetical protein [Burkholderia pseudomallei]